MLSITGTVPEANSIVSTLSEFGIHVDKNLIDNNSRNTYDNAYFTKLFCLNYCASSLKIVTSKFHVRRAKMIFNKMFGDGYTINFITVAQDGTTIQSLREKLLLITLPIISLLPSGDHIRIKRIIDNLTKILGKPLQNIYNLVKIT